jgi:hypothetical protein
MVRSMSVEAAFELLELLRDAGLSEQDEILTFTQRIVDRHPFGCTDEDMEESGTLVKRIRARRAVSSYARSFREAAREAAQVERVEIPISAGSKNTKTRVSVESGRSGSASASIARLVPDDVRRGSVHKKAGFYCWSPASSRWKRTLSGWKRTLS